MPKFIPVSKNILFWGALTALLIVSAHNQFSFSLKPLGLSLGKTSSMLAKNDMQKLEAAAPDLFSVIEAVKTFPASTRFYFIPCFNDSNNTVRWWWYVHLMARYFAWPRTFFAHDKVQYAGTKEIYIERFLGQAQAWRELDWMAERHIDVLILMRNDSIKFLRADDPIKGL